MTEKKQLIQVKALPGSSRSGYAVQSVNFAYVSSPATGRTQITELMTCREYVIKQVWYAMNNHCQNEKMPPLDLSKLRLLIVNDPSNVDEFRRKLFNGKAVLNELEKINNWSPSSITTVKHPNYNHAWLLTAPAEWMSQPQMLSIATWIIRLLAINGPINTDSYDAIEAGLFNIMTKYSSSVNASSDNYTYLKLFWDKLYIVMKYYQEIFGDIALKDAWPSVDEDKYVHIEGGLYSFVDEDLHYSKHAVSAQKRFRALCQKHLPRKLDCI